MNIRIRTLLVLSALAVLGGCSSLPDSVQKRPGRALLQGGTVGSTEVLIRAIDDGEVLFVRGYQLGSQAWVDPGSHTVSVMCRTALGQAQMLKPGAVTLVATAGATHTIVPVSSGGDQCEVRAN